jgi:hypothetical protein
MSNNNNNTTTTTAAQIATEIEAIIKRATEAGITIAFQSEHDSSPWVAWDAMEAGSIRETGDALVVISENGQYSEGDIDWSE